MILQLLNLQDGKWNSCFFFRIIFANTHGKYCQRRGKVPLDTSCCPLTEKQMEKATSVPHDPFITFSNCFLSLPASVTELNPESVQNLQAGWTVSPSHRSRWNRGWDQRVEVPG